MCGSLLSKFKGNKIDPALRIFPANPQWVPSHMKLANKDLACCQDRELWKYESQNGESTVHSMVSLQSNSSLGSSSESDYSSQDEIEDAVRALAEQRLSYPTRNYRNGRPCVVVSPHQQLMQTAHEILAFHAYSASSSSNTARAVKPLSSTNSTLPGKVQTAVAFDIPVGDKKTICPSARVPMRFRKRKVAPEPTLEDVKEKMRAAEERKIKELQRIRESARSRAGLGRPHPAEASAQATAARIAAKQAAAESKRNVEIEKRKQAGNRASRNRSRIAAAQAFAKTQLQSSIKQKAEKTEQRKMKQQQKIDRQNNLRERHAKKVNDRMVRKLKDEEDEIRADLAELETYHASDDGDESWGEEQEERRTVYEWEDFFTD
ncbi:hypothetical protein ACROYT_G013404 [Oculina patagonica]